MNKKTWFTIVYIGAILSLYLIFGEKALIWGFTGAFGAFLMWLFNPTTQSNFRDADKNAKKDALSPQPRKSGYLLKHKIIYLIGIFVVVGLVVTWQYYNRAQYERVCLKRIEYRPSKSSIGFYRINDDNFKTQDEAMNYCLKVLK